MPPPEVLPLNWVRLYSDEKGQAPNDAQHLIAFAKNRGGSLSYREARASLTTTPRLPSPGGISEGGSPRNGALRWSESRASLGEGWTLTTSASIQRLTESASRTSIPDDGEDDTLAGYFLGAYLSGEPCAMEEFEPGSVDEVEVLFHSRSGVAIWQHPLDFRCDGEQTMCLFHYTDAATFARLTNPRSRFQQVRELLADGKGIRACRSAPHANPPPASTPSAAFCIAILCDRAVVRNSRQPQAYVEKWRGALRVQLRTDRASAMVLVTCGELPRVLRARLAAATAEDLPSAQVVLAAQLDVLGELAEAEALYRSALESREASFGAMSPETLAVVEALADVLHARGRLKEAEEMFRRAHEARYEEGAAILGGYADVLRARGRLEELEQLHRQSFESAEARLGARHARVLARARALAKVLGERGKFDEAEALLRRVLEGGSQGGLDSPDECHAALACVLEAQGKLHEAESVRRSALALCEEASAGRPAGPAGASHEASAAESLGVVLGAQGKLDEAEAVHRRALAGFEKALGSRHPRSADSRAALAGVLHARGRAVEADRILRVSGSSAALSA